jgi:hypothetical protein
LPRLSSRDLQTRFIPPPKSPPDIRKADSIIEKTRGSEHCLEDKPAEIKNHLTAAVVLAFLPLIPAQALFTKALAVLRRYQAAGVAKTTCIKG